MPPIDRVLGVVLMAVMATELLARSFDNSFAQSLTWIAVGATVLASIPKIRVREVYLLSVCAVLALLIWRLSDNPLPELGAAMSQAAFLMAFVLLLGLLHEAAGTSPSISALGRYLSRQPAGRRFYALFSGTGIMAILFNLGTVSFLVPLIQRGIRDSAPDDPLNPIRERRQVSALLRGFGFSVIWSPTAIAPLALIELIPGIDRNQWMLLGLVIFLLFMVLGALEDRMTWRAYKPRAKQVRPIFPKHAGVMFALACTWLLSLSILVSRLLDETIIFGLMVVCPVMLVGWLAVQNRSDGHVAWNVVGARLNEIGFSGLPASARVAVTLGCSGFIGSAASALVPAQAVADSLQLGTIPDFLLLSALPPFIAFMSFFGLSPIMTSVFLGSFFGALAVLPADATLIALAISLGWAISMILSPFATVVLIINRVSGYAPVTLTLRWNLVYGLLCLLANVPIFAFLVWALGP